MTQKTRLKNLEDFGYGPNVMRNTKVCAKCGQVIKASASFCPDCGERLSSETLFDRYKRQHPCCPECDTVLAPDSLYCPHCGTKLKIKKNSADKKFCPDCGARLPEGSVAQGAVCPSCGKQNVIGTKFCQDCGTKLPVAVQEEQMHADDHASVMSKWDKQLPQYPKWNCGGSHFEIEVYDGFTTFSVNFDGNTFRAKQAVEQYRQLLLEGGFREAGENPTIEHLYKMIDGVCYHADTEHCFEGDNDTATIYFNTGEPQGGFYYKPDKKSFGLKGLFGI